MGEVVYATISNSMNSTEKDVDLMKVVMMLTRILKLNAKRLSEQ